MSDTHTAPAGGILGGLSRRLKAGDKLLAGWASLGFPETAETMIREGFDTAILDMQHGAFTVETAIRGISAVALAGASAIVRIPVGDFATASRMLDGGASGIIAPMINSVADARAFASFVKYPPIGDRSWGPHRALTLAASQAPDYLAQANRLHLAIPMIETRAALDALDGILALDGVDGVFVGPSDLSIALNGGKLDPFCAPVEAAVDHIVARARAAGKFASMFCLDGAHAKRMLARGFSLCSVATDALLLRAGAKSALGAAR